MRKHDPKQTAGNTIRQKAEDIWRMRQYSENQSHSESETLKLIHELQVHQIELELQNDELSAAKEKAETASEKYSELFDFAPLGYYILNREKKILDLNFRGALILGKERALLNNVSFAAFVADENKKAFNKLIDKVFGNRTLVTEEVTLSVYGQMPMTVHLSAIAQSDEQKCLLTAVDITPLKKLESELTLAKRRAEESNLLKTAFLQNMSHEIRTPMNAIKGFSELLLANHYDENKSSKFLGIISQSSTELLIIINNILDIAKIESGSLPLYMEECSLFAVFDELHEIFAEYRERFNKQHLQFSWRLPEGYSDVVIITDKGKLKQILTNLLANAFKFTDSGCIEFGCGFDKDQLKFFVSDTGIGIPESLQNNVFERFVQLSQNSTGVNKGTGLGLSIVKGLIGLLDGEIGLVSEAGKGTTFAFSIPCYIKQRCFMTRATDPPSPGSNDPS